MTKFALAALPLLMSAPLAAQTADPDTKAWWDLASELSSDAMEGRDTGSPGYDRAAQLVADYFKAAGLKPMGENGGWFQRVPMREVAVTSAAFSVGGKPLTFLHDITFSPTAAMATTINAPLAYRGYCGKADMLDITGKLVICHGSRRDGLPDGDERQAALEAGGGIGMITIADPGFTVEPPRWPFAYARSVSRADQPVDESTILRFTLNAEALGTLVAGAGQDADALIAAGSKGLPLPNFDIAEPFEASIALSQRDISSSNVIAMLPGTDPALSGQAIVLSAHLDGYGYGEPVNGDNLYNGTLDDAAYVALLIRLAQARQGQGYARPIIFAAFTGEEKGLIGARWFVDYPTLPKTGIAANINLDQLRPIFPLELLTVHALDDSSLGDDVRAVTSAMNISVQHDPEPERNLLRRADQWPFLQAGIPATAFVFGYQPGSESERIYRKWYVTGYHKPQDDSAQPINWQAASDFNRFFYQLVGRVANAGEPPKWKPGSPYQRAEP